MIRVKIELSTALTPWLYLALIIISELVMNLASQMFGTIMVIVLLFFLVYQASRNIGSPLYHFYLSIAIVPVIQLITVSISQSYISGIYWNGAAAIPILLAAFTIAQKLNLNFTQVGINARRLPVQLLIALSGIPLGFAEYYLIEPAPLLASFTWAGFIIPAIIIFVGIGFTEELAFRGIIQRAMVNISARWGWIFVVLLYSILHVKALSLAIFGVALVTGLYYGWLKEKTGSIIGITLAHGLAVTLSYLVVPFLF